MGRCLLAPCREVRERDRAHAWRSPRSTDEGRPKYCAGEAFLCDAALGRRRLHALRVYRLCSPSPPPYPSLSRVYYIGQHLQWANTIGQTGVAWRGRCLHMNCSLFVCRNCCYSPVLFCHLSALLPDARLAIFSRQYIDGVVAVACVEHIA